MIDFILDTIFWFVVFWLIIKVWQKYLTAKNEALVEQIKDMQTQIKNSIILVEIEKHDDIFYLYDKDTREFIAQGTNFDEIREHCKTRFKDRAVVANEEQMEQLGLK
jgi:type IV secretory pathway VirB6-like protein